MRKPVYFTFELLLPQVTKAIGGPRAGRRGKLTKPLFITPAGLIEPFPTEDGQFSDCMPKMPVLPENHPKIPSGSEYSMVMRDGLEKSSRFQR